MRTDRYFVEQIIVPYFSSIFSSLVSRQPKSYLSCVRMKQYLNLPELLGARIVKQINRNGDERIDHNEFVSFMLKLFVGKFDHQLEIAFRCFDLQD